ncbi:3-oxoadipate enol-lactonase 2 [Serratia quinivorans]|uniref:3-oxoadipate enol-lactonase n=1 Tax=Serratia quinivorans TaxID=137545 RepID=UPI00217B7C12|nr:3-oxoadipate enol-lactonase [Serratia quinivorans]CAI0714203.1 3-oxoadipate enol-lactonase 2 [Serratia quinivorans]CAI1650009.1 3-oxoadipate enol-lactonase 2 [Serratia quinivorans]CAI1736569.1 3-oxoadipate enol-lactonase 2 [Serratia quinivorans]CAI2033247.1 3-oxoadipate enol-lactonase 2 [Serratia quinivorans]CAI2060868.1 3-oxoadipate enol-lactonase 2 [Serratia quinivorans]
MSDLSFITTGDGCKIAYRVDGEADKPLLVLSNSIGTTLAMWDDQIAALSAHFTVLRYDSRGHGASGAPAGAYSIARLGRDVLELLDALQFGKVFFCGLSLGGMVGQWLGIHAPQRIKKLILANTSSYLGPADQWDARINELGSPVDMNGVAEGFLANWFSADYRQQQPARVAKFREMLLATPPTGLAGCFAAVRDLDMRRTVALITSPTLVIAGRDDKVTALSHGELLASSVPGAELQVLPVVHLSNVERPDDFLTALRTFLLGY